MRLPERSPDFALIEPNMVAGHGDYHPACGRSFRRPQLRPRRGPAVLDPGRRGLPRAAVQHLPVGGRRRTARTCGNTTLLIGWDEPGGTTTTYPLARRSARPGSSCRPISAFTFDRSGYRVPAILVSPWVEHGSVFNDEYRHTSLIATLRKNWNLGRAFSQREASARTFDHLFTLDTPRNPQPGRTITPLPCPAWHMDEVVVRKALSTLGKAAGCL